MRVFVYLPACIGHAFHEFRLGSHAAVQAETEADAHAQSRLNQHTIRSQKGRTATLSILNSVSANPGDMAAVVATERCWPRGEHAACDEMSI